MTVEYTLYDNSTGRIQCCGVAQDEEMVSASASQTDCEYVLHQVDGDLHYIIGGVVYDRPAFSLVSTKSLSVDEDWEVATFPPFTTVYVDGELIINSISTPTPVTLSFDMAGEYKVDFYLPFPHFDKTVVVTVT